MQPGLLIERESRNLISSHESVDNQLLAQHPKAKRLVQSEAGSFEAWIWTLEPMQETAIRIDVENLPNNGALTVSCHAWSNPEPVSLEISIQSNGHSIRRTVSTSVPVCRHSLTLWVPKVILTVHVTFRIANTSSESREITFSMPVIEPSASASSYCPPGFIREPDLFDFRVTDSPLYDRPSGSFILVFMSLIKSYEYPFGDDQCLFGLFYENKQFGIEILVLSENGQFAVAITRNGNRQIFPGNIQCARNSVHAVAFCWEPHYFEISVDGAPIGSFIAPDIEVSLLVRVRLGGHPFRDSMTANISAKSLKMSPECLAPWQLYEQLVELDPERYWYFAPLVDRLKEAPTEGWSNDIIFSLFKVIAQWQTKPPPWLQSQELNKEATYRDDIMRCLAQYDPVAEPESDEGKTDLLLKGRGSASMRVEFTIWGRHDYDDVPTKPLKYMTDLEDRGVVVMINNQKLTINSKYIGNVYRSSTSCERVYEFPFGYSGAPFHFISEHSIAERKMFFLHIVFNTNTPLQRDSQQARR